MNIHQDLSVTTNAAYAGFEDHQFWGYEVFHELLGRESWGSLLILSITGRRISSEEQKIIDDIAVINAMADPRIWPLKITSLVASYGDPVISTMVGSLMLNKAIIGPGTIGTSAELLMLIHDSVGTDALKNKKILAEKITEILKTSRLYGFGVAFRPEDERLQNLKKCVAQNNRTHLPYWRLLDAVSEVVFQIKGIKPNIASGTAAVLLDMGFSPSDIKMISVALFQTSFFANAVDGISRNAEVMRCLPKDRIQYVGRALRQSPRFIHASRNTSR